MYCYNTLKFFCTILIKYFIYILSSGMEYTFVVCFEHKYLSLSLRSCADSVAFCHAYSKILKLYTIIAYCRQHERGVCSHYMIMTGRWI